MKTQRISALTTGTALIIMAVAAIFTFGYIHNSLVIPGDATSTVQNLQTSRTLFKVEIFGWLYIFILDAIVAAALYVFFKDENRKLALATAGLRFVYTAILGLAIFNLSGILEVLNGNLVFPSDEINSTVINALDSFTKTWTLGLIVFGFHLLVLGILALKTRYIHRFFGIFLSFAGVSYIVISSLKILFPEFESQIKTAEMILSIPMALGELGFAFWLIFRGGKPVILFRNS